MQIITDIQKAKIQNSIVTLGKFDGNHIGHQLLFQTAVKLKEPGDQVVIFTFNILPAVLLEEEEHTIRTIRTYQERQLQSYPEGIDYVIEFPFNEVTRNMSPEEFVKTILVDQLHVKAVVIGEDFHFGKNRTGNVESLRTMGAKYGFRVVPLQK